MNRSRKPGPSPLDLCGQLQPDDQLDPRIYFSSAGRSRSRHADRRLKQLCRQIFETLDMVLSGESRSDLLRNLRIVSVDPVHVGRVVITVVAEVAGHEFDEQAILQALDSERGRLRCEVASAVTRRKIPSLTFRVLGPDYRLQNPSAKATDD